MKGYKKWGYVFFPVLLIFFWFTSDCLNLNTQRCHEAVKWTHPFTWLCSESALGPERGIKPEQRDRSLTLKMRRSFAKTAGGLLS